MQRSVITLSQGAIAAATFSTVFSTVFFTVVVCASKAIALEPALRPELVRTESIGASLPFQSLSPQSLSLNSFPTKVVLSLSQRRVSVYRGEMLTASYEVAVGREGWNTPTGEFSVFQKQINPAWEHPFTAAVIPPGPDNPLGARWIGFWSDGVNSIGFHGTPDESVIGGAVSHGCVRMRNEDVLALYEQVELNTPVVVLP